MPLRPITGTFIDAICCDIPSQNWSRKDWSAQFDILAAMGMDTVVIIRVGFDESMMFRSRSVAVPLAPDDDLVRMVFEESDRLGLKAYMGLYDSNRLWPAGRHEEEVRLNLALIDELWERYAAHRSFHGWYLSHEGRIVGQQMARLWTPLARRMRALDAARPILISPRYEGIKYCYPNKNVVPPDEHARQLDSVLSEVRGLVDQAAFMDGHPRFGELEGYLRVTAEVCRRHGVAFWSNLETFDRDVAWRFPPIEWMKVRCKLELAQPYVEKVITFEAPHFLSPLSMYPSARGLYERYMAYVRERS